MDKFRSGGVVHKVARRILEGCGCLSVQEQEKLAADLEKLPRQREAVQAEQQLASEVGSLERDVHFKTAALKGRCLKLGIIWFRPLRAWLQTAHPLPEYCPPKQEYALMYGQSTRPAHRHLNSILEIWELPGRGVQLRPNLHLLHQL